MFADTHSNTLGWLLDQKLGTLTGVACAVLLTADGLLHSRTSSLDQDQAERRAAVAAGLRGAARGYNDEFEGDGVRQVVLELTNYVCLLTQAGENALLLVQTTDPDADLATIAHQAAKLAASVGEQMAVGTRQPLAEEQAAG
ncbi:roadblock/LC7 domain-containing protein [Streptomyces goshikiensis]|uniref:roadblock/LC7 domain-containing protein n=1 Tax=Streptomyces goshikiensis TaxID=1942 RepID=UPI00381053DD